jgi:arylsulfatase A-like enzyme
MSRSSRRSRRIAPLVLATSVAFVTSIGCQGDATTEPPKNVILFVIDTLRADRVGAYGNGLSTTPNIDAFASQAVLFENAYAPSPHTAPSHASLFTSTYPATHGVWNNIPVDGGENLYPALSERNGTLAEVLNTSGFQTAAFADGGWLVESRGLAQGFDSFHSKTLGTNERVDSAIEWLIERDRERPFFLFLHSYEVHAPYMPPIGSEDRFAAGYSGPLREALANAREYERTQEIGDPLSDLFRRFFRPLLPKATQEDVGFLLALYDAELEQVDRAFARLLAFLEREKLLDDTLVVITSDHGEEFREHGKWTHTQMYREVLKVPLIIRDPRRTVGERRSDMVDLIDVMPTVLASLGVEAPSAMAGHALDLTSDADTSGNRLLVGETNATPIRSVTVRSRDLVALFKGDELEGVEVFDARTDLAEAHNIASTERGAAFVERARRAIEAHYAEAEVLRDEHGIGPRFRRIGKMSDEQLDQLRMLGYLE